MIDPNAVTHFSRTGRELEEFALFCVVVAGKTPTSSPGSWRTSWKGTSRFR